MQNFCVAVAGLAHPLPQTLHLFDSSLERRRTACTDLNEHSSRSHSIFTISVESLDFEADPTTPQVSIWNFSVFKKTGDQEGQETSSIANVDFFCYAWDYRGRGNLNGKNCSRPNFVQGFPHQFRGPSRIFHGKFKRNPVFSSERP